MINEKLKAFARAAGENEELNTKLSAITDPKDIHKIIDIAKEYGFDISQSDIDEDAALSQEDLEVVAGGKYVEGEFVTDSYVLCLCLVAGGGDGVRYNGQSFKPCACVLGGGGSKTPKGDFYNPCVCVAHGQGDR